MVLSGENQITRRWNQYALTLRTSIDDEYVRLGHKRRFDIGNNP